jgi:oxygen-independent coproporphyrinogen-3 oxidase
MAVDESLGAEFYESAIDELTGAGFEHYEVSNFCRPGHACRHNEVYWTGRPYLGLGPGAASFCRGMRWKNHASLATYLRRVGEGSTPVSFQEQLEPEAAARERLVFGLRRLAGIEMANFKSASGFSVQQLGGEKIAKWIAAGLVASDGKALRLTRRGLMVSDSLWPELL